MSISDRVDGLRARLCGCTGSAPSNVQVVYSPLRICPLGAHVDHQDGLVTGMALDRAILLAFVPRADDRVVVTSANYPGVASFRLDSIPPAVAGDWGNYPRGAALALRGHSPVAGIDAIVEGDTPVGGLSSSAAVGVAFLLALEASNDLAVSPDENILLDRYIENAYLGVHNGILDQSIILKSQADHLTYLDCQTRELERVPTPVSPEDYDILIVYSGLAKSLVSTDYNRRVRECREAAAQMLSAAGRPIPDEPRMRMVPEAEYESLASQLAPPLDRRARHFITEIRRVREGVAAWRDGDLVEMGRLIEASGASSVHNYESGCPHLITLFDILRQCRGVYGARFAGGGFRGCCVGLSDPAHRHDIETAVRSRYLLAHPDASDSFSIHFCSSGGSARLLNGQ